MRPETSRVLVVVEVEVADPGFASDYINEAVAGLAAAGVPGVLRVETAAHPELKKYFVPQLGIPPLTRPDGTVLPLYRSVAPGDLRAEWSAGMKLKNDSGQTPGEYPCCMGARRVEAVPGNATTLLGGLCPNHGATRNVPRKPRPLLHAFVVMEEADNAFGRPPVDEVDPGICRKLTDPNHGASSDGDRAE